jgi:hypothetical protein
MLVSPNYTVRTNFSEYRHLFYINSMTRASQCFWLLFVLVINQRVLAGETAVSIADAGWIYRYQGEYLGIVDPWGGNWGAQVIATSSESVEIHLLEGGLPGLGLTDRKPPKTLAFKVDAKEDSTNAKGDGFYVVLKPDTLTIWATDKKELGVLTKIVRESSTLGATPPAGSKVLFEQRGINTFADSKLVEDGLLGVGCTSTEALADHTLHIEFKTPFQPSDTGQSRGNSGVYVQSRYEVQVLDSFGLAGEDNECGGIYTLAKPRINMCFPPLTWQTYDIDFVAARYNTSGDKTHAARITVKHNGFAIHEDVELAQGTPGKDPEGPTPAPLYLQDHGNPVAFRNIWVTQPSP